MTTTQTSKKLAYDMSKDEALAAAGRQVANTFLTGTAAGVGGVGLYHALRYLKEKRKQMTSKPSLAETALDVQLPPSPVKHAFDASSLALPLGGAGAGALLGAALSKKKNRLRNAVAGAGLGGAAGLGVGAVTQPENMAKFHKALGGLAVRSPTPGLEWLFGGAPDDPRTIPGGANVITNTVLAGGAGLATGGLALNSLLKGEEEKKQRDDVAASRDAYFNELIGGNEKVSAALDTLYEKFSSVGHTLANLATFGHFDKWNKMTRAAVGLGSLGAASYGAMHMYNKTMAKSHAKNLAAAAAARRRMQMANTPWVDPTDLAKIKDFAAASESPSPQMG